MSKMIRATTALAFAAAALFSGAASAADTFTFSNSGSGNGYVIGSLPSFTLTSSNNGTGSSIATYGTTASADQEITFTWSYTTTDWSGYYDPAGYYIDGTYYQVSDNNSATGGTYTGSVTFDVEAGQTYGWYDYSLDSGFGSSTLSVNVNVVPEPANLMLMLAGLGALGAVARRRKSA
jgi:hypothetical protein